MSQTETENKYQKYFIYKLCCNDISIRQLYIGATKNIRQRKYKHKYNCVNSNSNKHNFKVYKFIRENFGWDNWNMVLIKEINCDNRVDLLRLERNYIECFNATLNYTIPIRTEIEKSLIKKNYDRMYWLYVKKDFLKNNKKYCETCNCYIRLDYYNRHIKNFKHIKNKITL